MKGMWGEGAGFCTFFSLLLLCIRMSAAARDMQSWMVLGWMSVDSSGRRTGTTAAYGAEVLERFEDWSWKYLTIIRNISI